MRRGVVRADKGLMGLLECDRGVCAGELIVIQAPLDVEVGFHEVLVTLSLGTDDGLMPDLQPGARLREATGPACAPGLLVIRHPPAANAPPPSLAVTTKFTQAGLGVAPLAVMISTVWPFRSGVRSGVNRLSTLAATQRLRDSAQGSPARPQRTVRPPRHRMSMRGTATRPATTGTPDTASRCFATSSGSPCC